MFCHISVYRPIRPNMIITMIKSGGPTYVHNSHSDFTTLNNYISIYKLFHCSFAVVLLNEVLDGNHLCSPKVSILLCPQMNRK